MTPEEIVEGNKLIAGFVNLDYDKEKNIWRDRLGNVQPFKYHTSWDWLIPACLKFKNSTECSARMGGDTYNPFFAEKCLTISYAIMTLEILQVFGALVEAIKWYNQQVKEAIQNT